MGIFVEALPDTMHNIRFSFLCSLPRIIFYCFESLLTHLFLSTYKYIQYILLCLPVKTFSKNFLAHGLVRLPLLVELKIWKSSQFCGAWSKSTAWERRLDLPLPFSRGFHFGFSTGSMALNCKAMTEWTSFWIVLFNYLATWIQFFLQILLPTRTFFCYPMRINFSRGLRLDTQAMASDIHAQGPSNIYSIVKWSQLWALCTSLHLVVMVWTRTVAVAMMIWTLSMILPAVFPRT